MRCELCLGGSVHARDGHWNARLPVHYRLFANSTFHVVGGPLPARTKILGLLRAKEHRGLLLWVEFGSPLPEFRRGIGVSLEYDSEGVFDHFLDSCTASHGRSHCHELSYARSQRFQVVFGSMGLSPLGSSWSPSHHVG